MAWVQSLAQELLHAAGAAKKEKKKRVNHIVIHKIPRKINILREESFCCCWDFFALFCFFVFVFFFFFLMAALVAYGRSWPRGCSCWPMPEPQQH